MKNAAILLSVMLVGEGAIGVPSAVAAPAAEGPGHEGFLEGLGAVGAVRQPDLADRDGAKATRHAPHKKVKKRSSKPKRKNHFRRDQGRNGDAKWLNGHKERYGAQPGHSRGGAAAQAHYNRAFDGARGSRWSPAGGASAVDARHVSRHDAGWRRREWSRPARASHAIYRGLDSRSVPAAPRGGYVDLRGVPGVVSTSGSGLHYLRAGGARALAAAARAMGGVLRINSANALGGRRTSVHAAHRGNDADISATSGAQVARILHGFYVTNPGMVRSALFGSTGAAVAAARKMYGADFARWVASRLRYHSGHGTHVHVSMNT